MSDKKWATKYEFDIAHAMGKRLRKIFERDGYKGAEGSEDYLARAAMEAARWTCEYCGKPSPWSSRACDWCGKLPSDYRDGDK